MKNINNFNNLALINDRKKNPWETRNVSAGTSFTERNTIKQGVVRCLVFTFLSFACIQWRWTLLSRMIFFNQFINNNTTRPKIPSLYSSFRTHRKVSQSPNCCILAWRNFRHHVNRGEWLWSPVNIKGANKDGEIYVGRSTTLHNLLFCAHTLCASYVIKIFLLISSSVSSKHYCVLCTITAWKASKNIQQGSFITIPSINYDLKQRCFYPRGSQKLTTSKIWHP